MRTSASAWQSASASSRSRFANPGARLRASYLAPVAISALSDG